ncbi:unnamed protein product, partial [Mesorhabditis belari]|uniref:G-protein coupled receptors family 1 profile domain-containing protein n=1 Tax=Mesorhabditis belari TaxID=2138241 RepID=A0AAF3F2C3_9BILA
MYRLSQYDDSEDDFRSGCDCTSTTRTTRCCCQGKELFEIPKNLSTRLNILYIYNASITTLDISSFEKYRYLEELDVSGLLKLEIFNASLFGLVNLRKIAISDCPLLKEIRGKLIRENFRMQSLIVTRTGLQIMPAIEMTSRNRMEVEIDLSYNHIQYIGNERVKELKARSFKLDHNDIFHIDSSAFYNSTILSLNVSNNPKLNSLSSDAFRDIVQLDKLDLSHTSIETLPINGLKNIKTLALRNVPNLKKLPSVFSFSQLQKAFFTYPHHCCLFKHLDFEGNSQQAGEIKRRMCMDKEKKKLQKRSVVGAKIKLGTSTRSPKASTERDLLREKMWFDFLDPFGNEVETEELLDSDLPPFDPEELGFEKCLEETSMEIVRDFYYNITCTPEPDALNPCENIVGYSLLRRAIWVVWIAAILGNALVWIVLAMAYERRMRVHYLFMFNLSVGDLITGVYLAFLAIEDTRTADEYYRYAVDWQTGWGCSVAGFLAVFASQLSIISMFFIAFEMAYNTRKAIYGRRLGIGVGMSMMIGGYFFAAFMAILPLFGISSYSTSSICLPLRVETLWDKLYIMFGLGFNITAFTGMVISYIFIFWMLRLEDPNTPNRPEDKAVIKKMALLIITDMICWFPTLFFGLTAALGFPMISISNAKIFLVFFFPINSFMNPFLYVFFTKVIQRHFRNKAIPAIKKFGSVARLSTITHFYSQNPPSDRRKTHGEEALNTTLDNKLLGVTQTTDALTPCRTPRGSTGDCSAFDFPENGRRTPRVSFQEEIELLDMSQSASTSRPLSPPSTPPTTRRSVFARFQSMLRNVSAIPEVSEHSGSEGTNCVNYNEAPPRDFRSKPSSFFRRPFMNRRREGSTRSGEQDSGRGSWASISTNGLPNQERLSLSTNHDAESDEERREQIPLKRLRHRTSEPMVMVHRSADTEDVGAEAEAEAQSQKKAFKTTSSNEKRSRENRRQSVPAMIPLLIVSECSENSNSS